MKIVFTLCATLLVQSAVAAAQPDDTDLVDLDGDGDIDDADRAALEAAETITIEDKSEGKKLEESSRAVTVVDLKRAKERSSDLGAILTRVKGIQVRRSGGIGSTSRIFLNGLADEQVRYFVDGIPSHYAGWYSASGSTITDVPVNLVHRVDIYRGVLPIDYGADSLGGGIDLVTDPSWSDRAALNYEVGSFGRHRASLAARVRENATGLALDLALFTDRVANDYPINVEAPDDVGRPIPVTVRRFHDGYLASGANIQGGIVKRGPLERALIRVFHTQFDKELQHNTIMAVPYGEVEYASWSRGISGDVAVATGPWSGRIVTGVTYTPTDFRDVSTGIYDWFGNRIGERLTPGEIGSQPIDQRIASTGIFARATLQRTLGAHQRVRLAVAPTINRLKGTDFLDGNPLGRDPIEAKRDIEQLVVGAEHEVKAFDGRLENIAFAKFYHFHSDAEDARPGFIFVPIEKTIDRPGFGDSVRWKLTPSLALKGSYEWATRIPTVYEFFGNGVLIQQNLELEPETSHNVNVSLQLERETSWGAFGGEVGSLARFTDRQILLLGSDRTFSYQNVFATRILGVEGNLGWVAPGEWATLDASVSFLDLRNTSSEGTFGAFEGDRLPNRPWLNGALSGSIRHRGIAGKRDELSLFGDSYYVREYFRGWESLGSRDSKQVVPTQLVHGAGVTYSTRSAQPVSVTFEVQNLTDAHVFDSFGVQKPGRGYYLKLSGEL